MLVENGIDSTPPDKQIRYFLMCTFSDKLFLHGIIEIYDLYVEIDDGDRRIRARFNRPPNAYSSVFHSQMFWIR